MKPTIISSALGVFKALPALVLEILLVLGVAVALPWQRERLFILAMPPAFRHNVSEAGKTKN